VILYKLILGIIAATTTVERDGAIDYDGTDRITKTESTYATRGAVDVARTTTTVWAVDGNANGTVVSIQDVSLEGEDRWSESDGLVAHSTMTRPAVPDGSWTTVATNPDLSSVTSVYAGGRLQSRTAKCQRAFKIDPLTSIEN
jgi:hypothetical protein